MTRRVVLIRHNDGPADDRVQSFFEARGVVPETCRPFQGEALGRPDGSVAATVIYGGPYAAAGTNGPPFIAEENRWAEACMARDIPLLGICQGAQQIAHVLGAPVGPLEGEPHEFGYYPVHATEAGRDWLPETLLVCQAHYHGFALPAGAALLATGETFPVQAIRHGAATFALQFHPEVTRAGVKRWQDADWAPYGKPGVQGREAQDALGAAHDPAQHAWFMGFLERIFGAVLEEAGPGAATAAR